MEISARRAKIIGGTLSAFVFMLPLGWAFCSIWWGWEPPEHGKTGPVATDVAAEGPAKIAVERTGASGITITLRNAARKKMRVAVPGTLGRALRIVPAKGLPNEKSPARSAFDEGAGSCGQRRGPDRACAVVELLPGDSYSREYECTIRASPFCAVYDARGEGLPEGVWSGRAVSEAVR